MRVLEHKKEAPKQVRCKIITVSDTRTKDTDKSGLLIQEFLLNEGHVIEDYEIRSELPHVIREIRKDL